MQGGGQICWQGAGQGMQGGGHGWQTGGHGVHIGGGHGLTHGFGQHGLGAHGFGQHGSLLQQQLDNITTAEKRANTDANFFIQTLHMLVHCLVSNLCQQFCC